MTVFHIYPAIDIQGGKCVRLLKGDFKKETVYHQDPLDAAKRWRTLGAGRLHVVDLDGARTGKPVNREVVLKMAAEMDIPIQLGGGIRDLDTIDDYLSGGVRWVILGTKAVTEPGLLKEAIRRHPGSVVAGLDLRGGKAALEGWVTEDERDVSQILAEWREAGLERVIVTDIERDGTLEGIDAQGLLKLTSASGLQVTASGGIANMSDLQNLKAMAGSGISGAIIGKALYNGNIELEEALEMEEG